MRVYGYNVQFGDCFVIEVVKNGDALMVDYGSDTPNALQWAEGDILKTFYQRPLSVLLTHFHKDHINGFWETDLPDKVKIQNVYIPNIFAMWQAGRRFSFLQLEVLSELLSSIVLQQKPIEITLYSLLKRLAGSGASVTFLQRGSAFKVAQQEFQVLWPDFRVLKIDPRIEKGLVSLLNDLGILDGDDSEYDDKRRIDLPYIDKFIDVLVEAYSALTSGEAEDTRLLAGVEGRFQEMTQFIWARTQNLPREVLDALKERLSAIRNQGNRISLVFQDTPQNDSSKILMTGDVTASDMKKIIAGEKAGFKVAKEYKVIKAPHHGTHTHFVEKFPACETILVSNGKPEPRHRRWGKISYLYGGFYASHKKCQIKCTTRRCQLVGMAGTPSCVDCKGHDCIEVEL